MEMKDDYGNYIFESIRITLVCGMQPVCQPPPPLPFRRSPLSPSLPPPRRSRVPHACADDCLKTDNPEK